MKKRLFAIVMAVVMMLSLLPTQAFAAYDQQTGHPSDLNDGLYVAVYDGTGYPGEPAWYPTNNYTFINSSFGSGMSMFASRASSVLKPEILDRLTQGVTTDGVRVWGYYNAAGTKSMFLDSSSLLLRSNEEKIIRTVLGRNVDVSMYEIIWYVVKFQTDTYWHIDGLVVEKDTYNVNYYGNGNTAGQAPTGATKLLAGTQYEVLDYDAQGTTKRLRKVTGQYEWTFTGWNTKADGSGTAYKAEDIITINGNVSLYAQWQPPMTEIAVTKQWADQNDRDGIRPESISVHLLKDGKHLGSPVTLNAGNNWSATWNVPAVDENGATIAYAVEETVPDGYRASVTGSANTGFTITNSHTPVRTNVQVRKVWSDSNDRDGIRPAGVVVQLYADGQPVSSYTDASGQTVSGIATLKADSSWMQQWLGLEKYAAGSVGKEIAYTVKELRYVDAQGSEIPNPGYTVSYETDTEADVLVVENSYTPKTRNIGVEKVWDDQDNRDNIRPASVTVSLYADGEPTGKTLELNAENGWKGIFQDVYVNSNGNPIRYSVSENAVEGYTASVTGSAAEGFVVTNTHTPQTTSVSVNKVWEDKEDQDGIRPSSVTVELYADGVATGKTLELTAANGWSATFTGLEKNKVGAVGIAIVYTVQEVSVPTGYTAAVDGTTITNTHTPETADLNVQKVWQDYNNNDGKRPDAVIITLYANGQPTEHKVTLDGVVDDVEKQPWKATWEDMPRYSGGQRISYTVVETGYVIGNTTYDGSVPEYTVDHSYDTTNPNSPTATVTNIYTPETVGLNVQKVWDDDDNRDGIRPDSITVTLYRKIGSGQWEVVQQNGQNMTKTLSENTQWDATFKDLPKYSGGQKILYNAVETPVDGYTTTYSSVSPAGVVTITNSRAVSKIDVSVRKDWADGQNVDGIRPAEVQVTLYANGIRLTADGTTVKLNAENNWSHTWDDLYEYYNGNKIVYTVVEENVPEGYTARVTGNAATGFVVSNIHTPATISVPVTKAWVDNNDQDGIRPDSVTVTLYADGVAVQSMELTSQGNWTGSFDNLPKYAEGSTGVAINYTVGEAAEDVPEGYTASVSGHTITNTHEVELTQVSVTKVWDDEANQDGVRPESIELHLLANGKHTGKNVTVGAAQGWKHTWTGLDKYAEGKEINYTVDETPVGNGYSASFSRTGNEVVITNSRNVEKTSFTVQKVWVDANNQDNIRPYGIAVQLYADGVAYGDPVVLNAENHWRYSWSGLDVHAEAGVGDDVTYTVDELYYVTAQGVQIPLTDLDYTLGTPVLDPYTGITTLTNTHEVQTTDITVNKLWDDSSNQDNTRPAEIEVTLYRNGVAEETVKLSAENGWKYTWKNLPVHHGIGLKNVYTVRETNVPAGYTATTDGFTITNSHELQTVSVPVSKVWDDNGDQDGIRPDSVIVTLYADGKSTGKTLELNADNNWKGIFTDLTKHRAGKVGEEVLYTVKEKDVPAGYDVSVTGDAKTGYTVTNTHEPSETTRNAKKVWKDFNNNDHKRPYAVVVKLYKNGQPTGNEVILSAENEWSDTFGKLPNYENGQQISYTVVEDGYYATEQDLTDGNRTPGLPAGYTASHSYDVSNSKTYVATVTNAYTPETTGLNVQKVWDDDNNRDGVRPASVTVTLFRKVGTNGTWEIVMGEDNHPVTQQLMPANEWDVTFKGLPKYADGQLITYNAVETLVDGYEAPKYAYNPATGMVTITNTRNVGKVDVGVSKVWNDGNNQDGKRPEEVEVTLYANGIRLTAPGTTVKLNAENGWKHTWTDLYENYHGTKIVYTVAEENVPEGYTAAITGDEKTGFVVTNSHTPSVVDIPVTKGWADSNDQDGIRPDSITVTLYANDVAVKTLTLKAEDNWEGLFTGLPVYANGQKIVYTVKEDAIAGYEAAYSAEGDTLKILNTHKTEKTQLTAIKEWVDSNDQDGKRPSAITVHLLANGAHTGKKAVLSEATQWKYTWTELDKFEDGKQIIYTVYEEPVYFKGQTPADAAIMPHTELMYQVNYVRNPEDPTQITIYNVYTPETTVITAMKVWEDGNNRDGLRPETVTAELYIDGVASGKKLVLSEENGWVASWEELPKYKDHGVEIVYSVAETEVPLGYEASVKQETEFAPGLFIITNTHVPATTGITVRKVWNDEDNNDGKRPDGIIVQLYANGTALNGAKVVLSEANNWSWLWISADGQPLYVYEDGQEISYYVDEIGYVIDGKEYEGLPEGYTKQITPDSYEIVINNTRAVEKTAVSVKKVWEDNNNNDGIRPDAVTVKLLRNGTELAKVVLNDANEWKHTWTDLYKYVAGEKAVYTVEEETVEGYTARYIETNSADGTTSWTVTNTHEDASKELTVKKVWSDRNNAEKLRPTSVKLQLKKNGQAYGDVIQLNAQNGWKATIQVPVYESGQEITWTVTELEVPQYYQVSYDQDTLTVTNTMIDRDVPDTGDDSNLLLWSSMLMISCLGMVAVLLLGKKKRVA